jgi:hypothetical protein
MDANKQEGLVFEFTRDPALLGQFYRIYENEFKAVLKADYHHADSDKHDRDGHFLIVRRENLCVGGARLSVKTPQHLDLLPIEMGDFRIENYFPHLRQKQMRYGQIGRLCLLPEFRGGAITRMMFWHFFRKVVALDLDVIFATAPLVIARGHMRHFVAMGLTEAKIHHDITLPLYPMCEEIRFYLVSVVVDKSLIRNSESGAQQKSQPQEHASA